jgi:ribose transport system ATP-binding protein
MDNSAIKFENVTKSFPGVRALKNVSFEINKGDVHALIGENGAGKSTLLNILNGVFCADSGNVFIEGKKVSFQNTTEALKFGIAIVHQEINLVTQLTVGQNISLGFEPKTRFTIDFKQMDKTADEILKRLGCKFKSTDSISGLSAGEMQMIAIAKALYHKARIISLDEPTASLSNSEMENLFSIIADLKAQGITIIYVSHKLDEISRLCDRLTILRDGNVVMTSNVADITREEMIKNMVGRDVSSYAVRQKPTCIQPEVVLKVDNMCGEGFQNISFELHKGEILGISGLVGAKRTEIVRTLFGADRKYSGSISIRGKKVNISSPEEGLACGIGLLPEERKTQGFIKLMSNSSNMALASLKQFCNKIVIDNKLIDKNFNKYAALVQLSTKDPNSLTRTLSGGNQQKVILAKWLSTNADILIFDEPTKGVDVGAKAEIYALMEEFVSTGKSIIMVSSELPEIIGMSDNVVVVYQGRITAKLNRQELCEETILNHAMGE